MITIYGRRVKDVCFEKQMKVLVFDLIELLSKKKIDMVHAIEIDEACDRIKSESYSTKVY